MVAITFHNKVNDAINVVVGAAIMFCLRTVGVLTHVLNRDLLEPGELWSRVKSPYSDFNYAQTRSETNELKHLAGSLEHAINFSPIVDIDLRTADVATVVALTLLLIKKGINTAPTLHGFLQQQGMDHNLETYEFLLSLYSGEDRSDCLWRRDPDGRYSLLN